MKANVRTSWQVTRSVWYALFMREALARTTADRFAWFWMIIEPAAMIVIMVLIRAAVMGNSHHVGGTEFVPWFIVGLFGFYLYRENTMRLIGAIDANKALFAYRQVKPIDPVFIRSYVETVLKTFVFLIFIVLSPLLSIDLTPDNILLAFVAWFALWALGFGIGLILSVLSTLYPEIGKIARIVSFPLLLVSCVLFPIHYVPHSFREIVLMNPIVHGVELLRSSFFSDYELIEGISSLYLLIWVLASISLGMALHIRFKNELKAK
ncbi:ABC transporter permease [Neptunomonas phycophila]|uniref:ABC transporter permease n=1 Tax=Neptunomonas phycophila TaxID=1572645 RepID=UPI003734FE54